MLISKKTDAFNMYRIEISFGELTAIEKALSDSHADPVADELYAGIRWYMDGKLPKPGEEKEDVEAREQEAEEIEKLTGEAAKDTEADSLLPAPEGSPEDKAELKGKEPPEPMTDLGADEPYTPEDAAELLPEPEAVESVPNTPPGRPVQEKKWVPFKKWKAEKEQKSCKGKQSEKSCKESCGSTEELAQDLEALLPEPPSA